MFHPHLKRVIVLAASILLLAYAIATDEPRTKDTGDEEPRPDGPDGEGDIERGEISNVVDAASEAGQFGTWSLAVRQSGIGQRLEGDGPFTIFAPTDDAFAKLGETLDEILANETTLRETVERHIVEGRYASTDLTEGQQLTTLGGATLTVSAIGAVKVDGSSVVEPNLTASNGIIHGIDPVLQSRKA